MFLTFIGVIFDLKYRKLPYLLIMGGVVFVVARWSWIGMAWCIGCFIVAYLLAKIKRPMISEGDVAWLGIVGGMIASPVAIMFLTGMGVIVALILTLYPSWRRSMPFLVPLFLSMVFMVALYVVG